VKRPLGVTLVALYRFSLAPFWLILGFWFFSGRTWELIPAKQSLIVVAVALREISLGVGLWRLKNWARILTLILSVIWPGPSLFGGLIVLYCAVYLGNLDRLLAMPWYSKLVVGVEPVWRMAIVVYLLLPHVGRCFRALHPHEGFNKETGRPLP
jgi:hypothetical protein